MGKWTFGITMMIIGMGGTLLTLWILSLLMTLLKKICPISEENGVFRKGCEGGSAG